MEQLLAVAIYIALPLTIFGVICHILASVIWGIRLFFENVLGIITGTIGNPFIFVLICSMIYNYVSQ